MPFPLPARTHLPAGQWTGPATARVVLSYDERFLRRKRLVTEGERAFWSTCPPRRTCRPATRCRPTTAGWSRFRRHQSLFCG